jgi:hypothetical protein
MRQAYEELAAILGVDLDEESERESVNADPGPSKEQAIANIRRMNNQKKQPFPPGWID